MSETVDIPLLNEDLLLQLQAQKDRGLKLSFDDVLEGLARAKHPARAGIQVECILESVLSAYRDRVQRGPKGYSDKNFRTTVTSGTAATARLQN